MHPNCIKAVNAVAGRPLSSAKLKAIENAIDGKMRELARLDGPRWRSLTREQQMIEGATAAAQDVVAQAALREARGLMQINRVAETEARVSSNKTMFDLTRSEAWIRDMEQAQTRIDQIRDEAFNGLAEVMEAVQIKDGAGFWRKVGMTIFDLDNPEQTRAIVREVFAKADGHTGNAVAKQAARAYLDTIEGMRVRFNSAGGDIGKLGYGYLSQHHDQAKIHAVRSGDWADKVLPLLDRQQYLEADGSLTPLNKVREMLVAAHETLATGGDNKREPGGFKGSGARANRGSDARVLHFKDGDAWMDYMAEFGEGSLYDAMMGHIGRASRDIGLVESFGPNVEQTARVQNDLATRADGEGTWANRSHLSTPEQRWQLLNGATTTPFNPTTAVIVGSLRAIQTAAKLGGAIISSITDIGTIASTLRFNRLPYFDYLSNLGHQAMSADTRAELQAHGIMGEVMTDSINRWTGENITSSIADRLAGATMKFSFMNAWTSGLRRAFSMTMMKGFAGKLGKGWAEMDEWDQHLLQRKGITEADWDVISRAQPTSLNGRSYLTPEGIIATGADGARQIATKWGAFVSDEAQFAVINPDQATRAIATGGLRAGTIGGEAWRCAMQFKSFPMAMITRHWDRMLTTPQGLEGAPVGYGADSAAAARVNRIALFAGFNVSLTLLGAMVLQTKALIQGKDPMNMDPEDDHGKKFWLKALAQGGGMSFVADALLADPAEGARNWEKTLGMAGPVAGTIGGLLDVGPENLRQWLQGKDTHLGAEALRWVNSNLPGVNLWQVRTLWQRAFIDQAQESLNPGYLSRMRQRAHKDFGSSWWWSPGEVAPDRAPDLEKIGG
jgi:hypothetical protein